MKIAIRKGHMLEVDLGVNGLVNEYEVNRAYTPYVIAALQRSEIDVIDVTPEEGSADNMYDSIHLGINKANEAGADLFISCHVNSFYSSDVHGSTGYCYPGNKEGAKLIESIISSLSEVGFYNRGHMEEKDYYELKDTIMTAVIVEPFFSGSPVDVGIYNRIGPKGLGEAIAKGILNYLGKDFVPDPEVVQEPTGNNPEWVRDLIRQGIQMQYFDDHLEVRKGEGPWKIITFSN